MKADAMLERIEGFNRVRGGGVIVRKVTRGYTLLSERPVLPSRGFGRPATATRFICCGGTAKAGEPQVPSESRQ